MEFIQGWVRGLVALVVLVGFVELMLPQDGFKPYVRMILGLLVVLALIRPIIYKLPEWQHMELTLAKPDYPVEDLMTLGENIRRRGAAAASRLMPVERQLEEELRRRIPDIGELHIRSGDDGRCRIWLLSQEKSGLRESVWRELKSMGWNEQKIEVITDGR